MCELMGMSANVPTDAEFSFTGVIERGGGSDIHRDGWGIAFYRGRGVQEFRDPQPGVESDIARLVKRSGIKSTLLISHIRRANIGGVSVENTHPFVRELWGNYWTFAHNGQLRGAKKNLHLGRFKPVGSTDSEHVFCWLLDRIAVAFTTRPKSAKALWRLIDELTREARVFGVFNFLMSDSRHLYAHCSTRLHWLTRQAPFGSARLKDLEMSVDFSQQTSDSDVVTIIATDPLTSNEHWHRMESGQIAIWKNGRRQSF